MSNVGIIASSVVTSTSVDVLMEPFNNFTDNSWTASGASIVAGRTGTGAQISGTVTIGLWTIPAASESANVVAGFAWRVNSLAANRHPLTLRSDATATNHVTIRVGTDGSLSILRGGTTGTVIAGPTAAGLITINTWYYLELSAVLGDSPNGQATLRLNGTTQLTVTNGDTKNAGSKTVFDSIALPPPGTSATTITDDLYLTVGAGATFKGDTTIP